LPHRDRNYAFVGVDDLIVVDTEDALLIAKRGSTQDVKLVVDRLKAKTPKLVEEHRFEERPWGQFEILRDSDYFKSKKITVEPGQQLSLQSHAKREEHWIIVKGIGEVVLNDQVIAVKYGSHIHIPLGAKHRMKNTGAVPLEFIEVQMGSYFGEDDIVRYQDDYNRK
jgi:mannose-1-phosphate guanylyltransferase/mannose-1-phosphate guanylyltransferase/mannose-6-phosphate isomerase